MLTLAAAYFATSTCSRKGSVSRCVGDDDDEREQRESSLQVSQDLSLEGMPGVEGVLDCCFLRRL